MPKVRPPPAENLALVVCGALLAFGRHARRLEHMGTHQMAAFYAPHSISAHPASLRPSLDRWRTGPHSRSCMAASAARLLLLCTSVCGWVSTTHTTSGDARAQAPLLALVLRAGASTRRVCGRARSVCRSAPTARASAQMIDTHRARVEGASREERIGCDAVLALRLGLNQRLDQAHVLQGNCQRHHRRPASDTHSLPRFFSREQSPFSAGTVSERDSSGKFSSVTRFICTRGFQKSNGHRPNDPPLVQNEYHSRICPNNNQPKLARLDDEVT